MTDLTRPQLLVLAILADGPAHQSNATSENARTVSWRTVQVLERLGLAIDVARYKAILTDAGKAVAADPPEPPPIRYEHGTHACYVLDRCRCLPCCAAASEYEARRSRDNVQGRPRLVDAEPVRQHVREMMAPEDGSRHGVGLKQIAKVSGVPHGSLWKADLRGARPRGGPSRTVRAATADKLMKVTRADMADGAIVDAKQTKARIRELRAAGATWTELGEQLGQRYPSNAHALLKRRSVTVRTAREVFRLWSAWKAGDWTPEGRRPGGPAKAKLEREAAHG